MADKEIVDYFPQRAGKSLEELGLKVHKKCCEGIKPMYLGFSKMSPHYREVKKSAYNDTKPLSPENVPVSVHPESIVYELRQALSDMQKEGLVDEFDQRCFD